MSESEVVDRSVGKKCRKEVRVGDVGRTGGERVWERSFGQRVREGIRFFRSIFV